MTQLDHASISGPDQYPPEDAISIGGERRNAAAIHNYFWSGGICDRIICDRLCNLLVSRLQRTFLGKQLQCECLGELVRQPFLPELELFGSRSPKSALDRQHRTKRKLVRMGRRRDRARAMLIGCLRSRASANKPASAIIRTFDYITAMAVVSLFASTLISHGARALEPITGWGGITFGMSRAEVQKRTSSETADCRDDAAPYNCKRELFERTIGGVQYDVSVDFIDHFGAARIDVRSVGSLGANALEIYEQYKANISIKYGEGKESVRVNTFCDAARAAWDRRESVVNVYWIVRTTRKFVVVSNKGSIVWLVAKEDLCDNIPALRADYLSSDGAFPRYELTAVYRQAGNGPDDF